MTTKRQACTPYLCCRDAARALDFYAQAFGAETKIRYVAEDGRLGHAEFEIEGSILFLSDEWPEGAVTSPAQLGGTTFAIHLMVGDVDASTKRAAAAVSAWPPGASDQPLSPFNMR